MHVWLWSKPSSKRSDRHIGKHNKPIIQSKATALGLVWLEKRTLSRMEVDKNKTDTDITPLLRHEISTCTECWYSLIKREKGPLSRKLYYIVLSLAFQDPQGDQLEWPYICQWLSFVLLLLQQMILDCTCYLQNSDRDQVPWMRTLKQFASSWYSANLV